MQLQVLSDLAITQVPAAVTGIEVLSYATAGDLIGFSMQFARVGSAPATYYVQSADGAFWQLINKIIIPQMFGALGNGSHDDTTDIQAAMNQVVNTTHYQLQSELYFPPGLYILSAPITMSNVAGIHVYGAGRLATWINNPAGTGVFKTNAVSYSRFELMGILGFDQSDTAPLFDLDWDGTTSTYKSQSNTFADILFQDSLVGLRMGISGAGGGNYQVSETTMVNCFVASCVYGVQTCNFNVLGNVILGGNIQSCTIGVYCEKGTVATILGTGFQLNTSWDIFNQNAAYDTFAIAGCRTESPNFFGTLRGSASIQGCGQPNTTGIFAQGNQYGTINLDTCICGGNLAVGGGGQAFFTVDNCQFNANVPTCFGSGTNVTINNTWVDGLLDNGGLTPNLPITSGYFSQGVNYTLINQVVTATGTIPGPGNILVTTAGITLTLPAGVPGNIPGDPAWNVIDGTGNPAPNITINAAGSPGTISGASSVLLNNPGWTLSFTPFMGGNAWLQK